MSNGLLSNSAPANVRINNILFLVGRLLESRLTEKTLPNAAYSGELAVSLHIHGGTLNHIHEREDDSRGVSSSATPRDTASRNVKSRAFYEQQREQAIEQILDTLQNRLPAMMVPEFHGELGFCLPIVAGECQKAYYNTRRVHRYFAERTGKPQTS
jgi:hypothetical protein